MIWRIILIQTDFSPNDRLLSVFGKQKCSKEGKIDLALIFSPFDSNLSHVLLDLFALYNCAYTKTLRKDLLKIVHKV